jgi:hypothetical protein
MSKKVIFLAPSALLSALSFLGALLLALTLPALAQQPGKVSRIGFLSALSPQPVSVNVEAFREGLRALGWVEGQNIAVEYRWADGKYDRLPDLAAELVRLKMDVIVTNRHARLSPRNKRRAPYRSSSR